MTTIEITQGGKEGAFRGDEGVYPAVLSTHALIGPFKSKDPERPNETYMLHEWGFAIDDDSLADDERMVWITSGMSTGQKSRTFGILTALAGGKTLQVGTKVDIETHLIGRSVLVDVRKNDRGYLDCVGVTPLPKAMQKPAGPKAAPAADPDDALPF
jgi:hypothetical protein